MKLLVDDKLIAMMKPELADWLVSLTPEEVAALQKAERICESAATALERKYGPDCDTNWAWAAIYLRGCLAES